MLAVTWLVTLTMLLWVAIGFAAGGGEVVTSDPTKHFDPQGKMPSTFTLEIRDRFMAELHYSDKRDFDEAKKGFIAEPPYKKIMADAGHVAWDMASYQWLLSGEDSPVAAAPGRAQHGLRPV